ncbi:hypothetical protein DM02DRAFT_619357 [Periconia macrospinosa]|uniref:Zn(2)-C6 fungal-type domain-containing protein n=1 Tax=Periconia macrospinosa TaxID=97972 RepID=A0A2V1D5K8_9PLEO|nr:hypothetical protein DM02DRAFT_619357 [Periconia macrospinosa]
MDDDILHTSAGTNDRVQKHHAANLPSSTNPNLNPRSCVTCRRRKVKCDKKQPCSNCARAKIDCIFPGPGRAPRKNRKPPDGELLDRLRRLEGVVQSLNAQVEEHEQEAAQRERKAAEIDSKSTEDEGSEERCPMGSMGQRPSVIEETSVEGLETRFGRLVVDQGRSRYVNSSFWASLNNEVEDLKSILVENSDDEETQDSPDTTPPQNTGFMFGYSSSNVDMLALHPPLKQGIELWGLYRANVDPLVKVLHNPTFELIYLQAIAQPDKISKSLEPLVFAIYYAAVTSVPREHSLLKWGEERDTLLSRYRFGLEQALARANFLINDEMVILQAFIIFMVLMRRNDDARKIWTLTGLAVRMAQTLGIHRDGAHFNLTPFEIEMRRRLWWQVCILDARASEDHGCDPTIVEAQFDTKMPLNVNDTDLHPDMKDFPAERQGFTEMTFSLIRFEVTNIFRRIFYVPPSPFRCQEFFSTLSIPEKERWISNCHQRLEDKYLQNCDMANPLCWITATLSRLIMSKMWLIVYHPHQRRDGGASLPQETKDKLFITSLENIEYSILIETEARTSQWAWLFRTYVQWHAIAFLLSELCVRTKGEAVERAWRALDATAGRWWFPLKDGTPHAAGQAGCLWKPLRKLMAKARAARGRELALERASQALKNNNILYPDFNQLLNGSPNPQIPPGQPNPQNLDKMLRPAAQRLGEMPVSSPPTWHTESPRANNADISPTAAPTTVNDNTTTNGQPPNGISELQAFNTLSEQGLDFLLRDVMEGGPPLDGTYVPLEKNNGNMTSPDYISLNHTSTTQSTNQNTNTTASLSPTTAPNALDPTAPDVNFTNTAAGLDDFSIADVGMDMDWTTWDDLVGQYGVDGVVQQGAANGAGHLGKVGWF